MTKNKDKKRSVRKRLERLSGLLRSVKDKALQSELGELIGSKLDEIDAFSESKGIGGGKKEKKKEKDKKGKDKSAAPKLPKLEPSKELVNELHNSQPVNHEAGND